MSYIDLLERARCSQYKELFEEYGLKDIDSYKYLDRDVLLEMGITKLGDRLRILKQCKDLRNKNHDTYTEQLSEVIRNISTLSANNMSTMNEELVTEKHCVIFILNDGTAKKVNINGCFNAESIKKRLIKRLSPELLALGADGNPTHDACDYDVFIVDYSKSVLRLLYDIELVTICHSNDRIEKNRLIFVSRDQTPSDKAISASKKLYLKTISVLNHLGSTVDPTNTSTPGRISTEGVNLRVNKDGLRKIFDQRPPSEFISTNLAGYFPHADTNKLQKALRESYRQSARISMKSNNSIKINSESNKVGDILLKHSNAVDVALLQSLEQNQEQSTIVPASQAPPPPQQLAQNNSSMTGKIQLMPESDTLDDYYYNSDEEPETVSLPTKIITPKNWLKGARIGSGSFGTVYLGMNAQTGELMAVKQVEIKNVPEGTDSEKKGKESNNNAPSSNLHKKMIDALQHEMSLLKELQHENIVTYYGSSQEGGNLNIFLEYVPGGSVSSMLNNYGPFEEPLIINFTRQILIGVAYLHRKNIIHRDIKGANILIDIKGCVKITDFGISKKLSPINNDDQNKRASLQGSVYWMSPEVVKQTATTSKADIWSTGCVVIEMFTGKHPFPDFSQMQALFKIGTNVTPEIPSWASQKGRDFIRKTFELDYQRRPTAIELLQDSWLESHIL